MSKPQHAPDTPLGRSKFLWLLLLMLSALVAKAEVQWSARPLKSFSASYPTGSPAVTITPEETYEVAWVKKDEWLVYVEIENERRIVRVPKSIGTESTGVLRQANLYQKHFVPTTPLRVDANLQYTVLAAGYSYEVLNRSEDMLTLRMPKTSPVPEVAFPIKYFELVMGPPNHPALTLSEALAISDEGRPNELAAKIAALKIEHACPAGKPLEQAEQYACIIESPMGAGTGFLMRDGDNVYCYTAFHVIDGMHTPTIRLLDGTILEPLALEVSYSRDIARMLVSDCPAALPGYRPAVLNEAITVIGNSQGRGRLTHLNGKVTGVGEGEVETNAGFTVGNSGSALVAKEDGRVLGVASYLELVEDKNDFLVRGTPFSKPRRVAAALDDQVQWVPAELARLASANRKYHQHKLFLEECFAILQRLYDSPAQALSSDGISNLSLKRWIRFHNANVKEMDAVAQQSIQNDREMRRFMVDYTNSFAEQHAQFSRLCQQREAQIRSLRSYPGTQYQQRLNDRLLVEYETLNYMNDLILENLKSQVPN